jgi:hypothetical protein
MDNMDKFFMVCLAIMGLSVIGILYNVAVKVEQTSICHLMHT